MNGHGSSVDLRSYLFIDESPFHELNYYRLRQIDWNGDFEYSKTISVMNEVGTDDRIKIFPNPVTNGLIELYMDDKESSESISLNLYCPTGQLIKSDSCTGPLCSFDLLDLPKGIYFLSVSNGSLSRIERILID